VKSVLSMSASWGGMNSVETFSGSLEMHY